MRDTACDIQETYRVVLYTTVRSQSATCPGSQKFTSEQQFTQGTKTDVDSQGWEAKAEGKQIQGHPGLQEEILSVVVVIVVVIIII